MLDYRDNEVELHINGSITQAYFIVFRATVLVILNKKH